MPPRGLCQPPWSTAKARARTTTVSAALGRRRAAPRLGAGWRARRWSQSAGTWRCARPDRLADGLEHVRTARLNCSLLTCSPRRSRPVIGPNGTSRWASRQVAIPRELFVPSATTLLTMPLVPFRLVVTRPGDHADALLADVARCFHRDALTPDEHGVVTSSWTTRRTRAPRGSACTPRSTRQGSTGAMICTPGRGLRRDQHTSGDGHLHRDLSRRLDGGRRATRDKRGSIQRLRR